MKVTGTPLPGVLIIEPEIFKDDRGYFMETFNQTRYRDNGINRYFVQDNLSYSIHGTLRGLHFQIHKPQAKLIQVLQGEVFDVTVDVRPNSPHFGKWTGVTLSGENKRQLFIPEGFAHGFCVVSESALFHYKCSNFYDPGDEGGIVWNDKDVGIQWPLKQPIVSPKDKRLICLADLDQESLPHEEVAD